MTPPAPSSTGYAYIARKPCGCLIATIADEPGVENKKRTARRTGEWIEAGFTVERVTNDVVQAEYIAHCPHNRTMLLFEGQA